MFCKHCHKKITKSQGKIPLYNTKQTIVKQEYYHLDCWKELGKPLKVKTGWRAYERLL